MNDILVPVDFSESTERVVETAAALAQAFGGVVRLVHVAAPDPDFVGYDAGPPAVRDQVAAELRSEHRALQGLAEGLRARGVEAKALLLRGPTVETILSEAGDADADVIVLGSHGRGRIARALLGSVSEGVLRGASCPVMIIPTR